MRTRRLAVALVVPLVLTVAACSSDDSKKSSSPSASPTSADVRALVSKIRTAVEPLKTAHFDLTAVISGQKLTGTGDEKLAAGKLTALRADAKIPSGVGSVSIVVLNGKRYAKLPPPFATRSKPWLEVSRGSDNAVVNQVAGVVDAAVAASSLESLSDVVGATTRLRKVGTSGGTTHYTLTVDPDRLDGNGSARKALGGKPIPVQLYVDGSGRPVKVQVKVTIFAQSTNATVSFSRFDAPVTVSAPPADQVGAK